MLKKDKKKCITDDYLHPSQNILYGNGGEMYGIPVWIIVFIDYSTFRI